MYNAKLENRQTKKIFNFFLSITKKYFIDIIRNNHPRFSVNPQKADDLKNGNIKKILEYKYESKNFKLYFCLNIWEKIITFKRDKTVIENLKDSWLYVKGFK